MPKLTDTQLVVLSAAADRNGHAVLPLPKSLKTSKSATTRTINSLISRDLVTERPATKDDEVWREAEDGGRLSLVITDAGLAAIGVDVENQTVKRPLTVMAQPKKPKTRNAQPANGRQTKPKALPTGVRPGTKQALLIALLRRRNGVTTDEMVVATGWQSHSVRGAISGTLKKKLGLTIVSEAVQKRGRVYRIIERD